MELVSSCSTVSPYRFICTSTSDIHLFTRSNLQIHLSTSKHLYTCAHPSCIYTSTMSLLQIPFPSLSLSHITVSLSKQLTFSYLHPFTGSKFISSYLFRYTQYLDNHLFRSRANRRLVFLVAMLLPQGV